MVFDHQVIKIHYERKYFWFDNVSDFFAASAQAKDELITRVSIFGVKKSRILEIS